MTGGAGFMGSYLVQQLDAVARAMGGGAEVHYLDIAEPRLDMPALRRATFHRCSLVDPAALEALFRALRPDTVFHCASIVDCRPRPVPVLDEVNVGGTALVLALCRRHGAERLVYTSSIEVTYHDNRCDDVDESCPYPEHPTQGYQRTKIAAEKLVLDAHRPGQLATCSLRPGHIWGAGDDLFFLSKVAACFGPSRWPSLGSAEAAPMSMVHVENMACAHLLAAQRLREEEGQRRQAVGGQAFNVADWSQNIVSLYSEAAGAAGPMVTLPYWLLFVLVRCAVALSSASCPPHTPRLPDEAETPCCRQSCCTRCCAASSCCSRRAACTRRRSPPGCRRRWTPPRLAPCSGSARS